MKPYDLTGMVPALFINRERNAVLWLSGVASKDEVQLGEWFGKDVVWVKIVFTSRKSNAAGRIACLSLN